MEKTDYAPYSVRNEALFSYQPPFNILAFVILKPASWFLSPKALHRANVFLIRLTSLPQLIFIAIYERYLRSGQKARQSIKETASTSIFLNLPRHIKNMPLLEALLGSSTNDLYDAILDMELDDDYDIFAEYEDEEGNLFASQIGSREASIAGDNVNLAASMGADTLVSPMSGTSKGRLRTSSTWSSIARGTRRLVPRSRLASQHVPNTENGSDKKMGGEGYGTMATGSTTMVDSEEPFPSRIVTSVSGGNGGSSGFMSPLARYFNVRNSWAPSGLEQTVVAASNETNASVKKVEALLTEVKGLPVNKLKDEMKEIQERQNRIESLLLTLTRGMRNDKL
ncbi:hypothetical protein NP233_g2622 [Leucocoprinus birnbaumii]|uniref:Uncharacterized protein n=1 Tax=Leucocoprinus birnbaumii TaxID=56174 RepID=A0AAD5W0D4_9AGAR|nr:hypothetical protein NP233_g2622 [Leucocoprinus birnbaumii]